MSKDGDAVTQPSVCLKLSVIRCSFLVATLPLWQGADLIILGAGWLLKGDFHINLLQEAMPSGTWRTSELQNLSRFLEKDPKVNLMFTPMWIQVVVQDSPCVCCFLTCSMVQSEIWALARYGEESLISSPDALEEKSTEAGGKEGEECSQNLSWAIF